MDQSLGIDGAIFGEIVRETSGTFEEPVTLKRFSSRPTTPGAFQTAQAPQFTNFAARASVVRQDVAVKYVEAGIISAGDLLLKMSVRLNEGNMNLGGSQMGDRVIWRGAEYRMVQRSEPITFGGPVAFYIYVLRRTNAPSDVTGL